MSPLAILLIVVSAVVHAGWNLASKRAHPAASFFLLANATGAVLLAPLVLRHGQALLVFPGRVWVLLVATGFFMALYFAALAGAYRSGDMSVAYPLARSSPLLVVFTVTIILGRRSEVGALCVAGIVLVVSGCFLVPAQRLAEIRPGRYLNATCGLALLAAIGTAGYSIIDDRALQLLRPALAPVQIGTVRATLIYAGLEAVSCCLWLALFVFLRRDGRAALARELRTYPRVAVGAGVAIYVTYVLVLVAMAFARNVSYVVAFRQLSIPLGAVLGIAFLREPAYRTKIAGLIVLSIGLILVAVG